MSKTVRKRKKYIVGVFSRAAPAYDRIGPPAFSYLGRRLVELARIPDGAEVLDVATGTGAVLLPAAGEVGRRGRVIGVDLSKEMRKRAKAAARRQGFAQVAVHRMDAEHLDFPESTFDLVLCGMSIHLFPRLPRALKEFYRVLKPGGRVGLTTIEKDCQFLKWITGTAGHYLPGDGQTQGEYPAFGTPDGLRAALSNVGFADVSVVTETVDFVYADKKEWWSSLWTHGMRGALEEMTPADRKRFKAQAFKEIRDLERPDGIHAWVEVLLAFGVRA